MVHPDRNSSTHARNAMSRQAPKAPSGGNKRRFDRGLGSPQIATYIMELVGKRSRTFPEMATLAAERFGQSAPRAGRIARFVCQQFAGKSSLNRLGRDPELAAWLRENAPADRRLTDIRAACIRKFGSDRTPSRTVLAAFLYATGRRGRHGDRRRLDHDPKVAGWFRAEAATHTLDAAGCLCRPFRRPAHSEPERRCPVPPRFRTRRPARFCPS